MTRAGRRSGLALGAALLVALLVGGRWLALETAERAWAASVASGAAYVAARDLARLISGTILLVAVVWGIGNLYFVYRAIGSVQLPRRLGDLEIVEAVPQRVLLLGTVASGLLLGFALALGTDEWWLSALLWFDAPRFGLSDPLLHRDIGYYVGRLPWLLQLQDFALLASGAAAVIVALLYLGIGSLRFRGWRPSASAHARAHIGVLLACAALALAWGAMLDPAETVAGLHGELDRGALQVRLPGAAFVAVVAAATTLASLVWALREKPTLIVMSWSAVLSAAFLVYLLLPAIVNGSGTREPPDRALVGERDKLEALAFGTAGLQERPPPAIPTPDAALAALPVWDAARVTAAATQRQPDLLGPRAAVAGVALSRRGPDGGRASWLVAPMPDLDALARIQPLPSWSEIHRGPWARAGRPFAAVESDTGLEFAPLATADAPAWFGSGFREFALAVPDSWPSLRAGAVPLTGWWRRAALAWALQSPELVRAETDGLHLLWRRDVVERLQRLAPFAAFDTPAPLVADGALWWIAYGYLRSETFPLARALSWEGQPVRYLRAGLVGTVHAASGDTHLYLAPGADSLAAVWARLVRPLVRPLDALPVGLRAELPYPGAAFRVAAAQLARSHGDTVTWRPRPRDHFELPAADPDRSAEPRTWSAQGFEATPSEFAGLLAGTMSAAGPRLVLWRPSVRLPPMLVGSSDDAPGVLRFWNVGGQLFSEQVKFVQPVSDGAPRGVKAIYLNWGERAGEGPTPATALHSLLAGEALGGPADTSLAAHWEEARRLAARADAALAAGDLEAFGRYYRELRALLERRRRTLAPIPGPR